MTSINDNAVSMGTIPLEWQVAGVAADPPAAAASAASTAALIQVMAGFDASAPVNGAASAIPGSAETPQQPLLAIPPH